VRTVSAPIRVACAQVAPAIADPHTNRHIAAGAIQAALASGAQVIVLPELMTTGYHMTPAEASVHAEGPGGSSVSSWTAALAGSDAIVIGGFCELGADGQTYNSAAMVDTDGLIAVYRKTHLWGQEHRLFTPGSAPPPVVRTMWGPIGIAICYDLFFPELTRGLALDGAHLLAVPTNSPWDGPRASHSVGPSNGIGHVVARAAAYLNRVYVAVCDRSGEERGNAWRSRSSVIDPEGEFLAGPVAYAEQLLLADCNLPDAERKQWDGTTNNAFADRRPELYGSVISVRPFGQPSVAAPMRPGLAH
jgi:predicted amidohydrolase